MRALKVGGCDDDPGPQRPVDCLGKPSIMCTQVFYVVDYDTKISMSIDVVYQDMHHA